MPSIEAQYDQCRQWRDWLREAGYEVWYNHTGQPEPFDREWLVYKDDEHGERSEHVASFDIDGTGASWHGPDDLWLKVIGPKAFALKTPECTCYDSNASAHKDCRYCYPV
jgi:hypothetical protein